MTETVDDRSTLMRGDLLVRQTRPTRGDGFIIAIVVDVRIDSQSTILTADITLEGDINPPSLSYPGFYRGWMIVR